MRYRGAYNSGVSYSVGDVAIYTDGIPYYLQKAAAAGTACHDVHYWYRVPQPLAEMVVMFHSMLTGLEADAAASSAAETAISAMIAPEYTKKTYSEGDVVTHGGKLYAAKADIDPADASWTAAHWEQTTVAALIAAVTPADNSGGET